MTKEDNLFGLYKIICTCDINIFEKTISEIMAIDYDLTDKLHHVISRLINYNRLESLLFLIEQTKIDPSDDRYSNIYLGACCNCKNYEIIKLLIEKGLNINKLISDGKYGCLIVNQCQHGNYDIVKLLVENGANINIPGHTALRAAAEYGRDNIVQLLIDFGADVNIENGGTLGDAARCGSISIIKLLLNAGINVELYGGPALEVAAMCGHEDIIKLLIECGVDVNFDNCLALVMAIKYKRHSTVYLLLKNGADINLFNSNNLSTILQPGEGGFEKSNNVFTTLCENGADPSLVMNLLWADFYDPS